MKVAIRFRLLGSAVGATCPFGYMFPLASPSRLYSSDSVDSAATGEKQRLFRGIPLRDASDGSIPLCATTISIRATLASLQRRRQQPQQKASSSSSSEQGENRSKKVSIASLQAGLPATVRTALRSEIYGGLVATLKRHSDIFSIDDDETVSLTALGEEQEQAAAASSTSTSAPKIDPTAPTSSSKAPHQAPVADDMDMFDYFDVSSHDHLMFGRLRSRAKTIANMVNRSGEVIAVPLYSRAGNVLGTVNVAQPLLTAQEVKHLEIPRYLAQAKITWRKNNFPVDRDEVIRALVQAGEAPPAHMGPVPDFEVLDQEYNERNFLTPSFIANVLLRYVPSFYVESRNVLRGIPPAVLDILFTGLRQRDGRYVTPMSFFSRYPMIFHVKATKYQRPALKLSAAHQGLVNHPDFGSADQHLRLLSVEQRLMVTGTLNRRHTTEDTTKFNDNSESAESSSSSKPVRKSLDITIFQILLKYLPMRNTGAGDKTNEFEWLPLVQWINSFSPEDIETLNRVPQQRVLTIIMRYARVFQLSSVRGEDENLYFDASVAAGEGKTNKLTSSPVPSDAAAAADEDAVDEAAEAAKSSPQALDPQAVTARVEKFKAAVTEELVGVDEILSPLLQQDAQNATELVPGELVDRGGEAVEYSSAELAEMDGAGDSDNPQRQQQRQQTSGGLQWNNASAVGDEEAASPSTLDENEYFPTKFDSLLVRRLPPGIAPRCLNNLDEATTPHKALLETILSFLEFPKTFSMVVQSADVPHLLQPANSSFGVAQKTFSVNRSSTGSSSSMDPTASNPSSMEAHLKLVKCFWRWIAIDDIYTQLSAELKSALKTFRGLANFLRLHGALFEVSRDKRFVIRHDRTGRLIPPLIPTQTFFTYEDRIVLKESSSSSPQTRATLIGDEVRNLYETVLMGAQFPTTRNQLMLLDPQNPVLDSTVLFYEISQFMPDHPVSMHSVLSRLPPIMRAALPVHFRNAFTRSPFFEFSKQGGSTMVLSLTKSRSQPRAAKAVMTIEEALAEVRTCIPLGGVGLHQLGKTLSGPAMAALSKKYGSTAACIKSNPQFFKVEQVETEGRNGEVRRTMQVFNVRS